VLGAAALVGCGAAVTTLKSAARPQVVQPQKKFTARTLFESDHIHEAAAQNVLNAHSKLPRAVKSKQEVKELVAKTFNKIIERMKVDDPETFKALEQVEMSDEQHHGIAQILNNLKKPSVMKIGVETAAALREAGSDDKHAQAKSVYDKLLQHKEELQAVYDEIMPKHMQELLKYKPGDGFDNMLSKDNVKLLKTIGGSYYNQFTEPEKSIAATDRRLAGYTYAANPAAPAAAQFPQPGKQGHSYLPPVTKPYMKAEEALGIVGTVAAEADAMLRIIKPLGKEFGHNFKVNPVITSAIGASDFLLQMVDCELDAGADANPVEGLGCPIMSSSAAFDGLRESLTMAGILGDNNPKNGKQGNHAGDSTVHEGVLDDSSNGKAIEETFPICTFVDKCKK
jgi:hypothetical protein